jgi:hypothetical protein
VSTFNARYFGTCDSCRKKITPGEEVSYAGRYGGDSALVHVDCDLALSEEDFPDLTPIEVCQNCWISPCDCE